MTPIDLLRDNQKEMHIQHISHTKPCMKCRYRCVQPLPINVLCASYFALILLLKSELPVIRRHASGSFNSISFTQTINHSRCVTMSMVRNTCHRPVDFSDLPTEIIDLVR